MGTRFFGGVYILFIVTCSGRGGGVINESEADSRGYRALGK